MNSLGGRQATVSVLRRGGAFGPAVSHRLCFGALAGGINQQVQGAPTGRLTDSTS